jgi:hypothetical protein
MVDLVAVTELFERGDSELVTFGGVINEIGPVDIVCETIEICDDESVV